MLKGVQKNMIWVRTAESRFFEGAYFVLRPSRSAPRIREGDMLREANRLLAEGTRKPFHRRDRRLFHRWIPFLAGVAFGMLLSLLIALILLG